MVTRNYEMNYFSKKVNDRKYFIFSTKEECITVNLKELILRISLFLIEPNGYNESVIILKGLWVITII